MLHYEVLQYCGAHFASTLSVLANLMICCGFLRYVVGQDVAVSCNAAENAFGTYSYLPVWLPMHIEPALHRASSMKAGIIRRPGNVA